MKKLYCFILGCVCAFPLLAQGQEMLHLYAFGSSNYGPSNAFVKDAENHPELRRTLAQFQYQYVDYDNMDKDHPLIAYTLLSRNTFPYFVITNAQGDLYGVAYGYDGAEDFSMVMDPQKIAASGVQMPRSALSKELLRKKQRREYMARIKNKMSASRWNPGIGAGLSYTALTGGEGNSDFKLGYYAGASVKYWISYQAFAEGGLTFITTGGRDKVSDQPLRLSYLMLPVDVNYRISGKVFAGAGLYGSYLLDSYAKGLPKGESLPGIRSFDAGFRVRGFCEFGNFRFEAAYFRGLSSMYSLFPIYNHGFTLGVSLILGQ